MAHFSATFLRDVTGARSQRFFLKSLQGITGRCFVVRHYFMSSFWEKIHWSKKTPITLKITKKINRKCHFQVLPVVGFEKFLHIQTRRMSFRGGSQSPGGPSAICCGLVDLLFFSFQGLYLHGGGVLEAHLWICCITHQDEHFKVGCITARHSYKKSSFSQLGAN